MLNITARIGNIYQGVSLDSSTTEFYQIQSFCMNVAVCTELQVADVVWIFEPNTREVRSDLKKLNEEEIRDLYSSPKIWTLQ